MSSAQQTPKYGKASRKGGLFAGFIVAGANLSATTFILSLLFIRYLPAQIILGLFLFVIFLPVPEKAPLKFIESFIREGVIAASEYFPVEYVYEYKDFKEGIPYIFGYEPHSGLPYIYTIVFNPFNPFVP